MDQLWGGNVSAVPLILANSSYSLVFSQTNQLEDRIRDLEGEVEVERQLRTSAVQLVETERDEARETLAQMEEDYRQLLDTNLLLDREISVYRNLLEQEEQR